MSEIILGLDLGVTSIGYCLFDKENNHIITAGSRIFQSGVDSSPVGKESPRNATRREKRQIRRQIFRRSERQTLLMAVLQDLDWLPSDEVLLDIVLQKNPYELRRLALVEAISLEELGRIFIHLSKRRGFKSSRKSSTADEDEDKGVLFKGDPKTGKKGISELQDAVDEGNFNTIGAYFASLDPHQRKIRNQYILRSQYIHEFDEIWKSQLRFHPEINKPAAYKAVVQKYCKSRQQGRWQDKNLYDFLKEYIIYFQRSLKSQKGSVGKCTFEPKSSRCPKSALTFQEYRIWDKLNSFRIIGPDRNLAPLSFEEKQKAYQKLSISKEQTVGQLMKLWKLGDGFTANYDEKIVTKGNVTAHALINVFGINNWTELSDEEKEHRWKIIYDAEDNEWLKKYGIEKWALNEEQAKKLTKVGFEKMYAELSQKAMNKILPFMKNQNLDYAQACIQAGYNHSQVSEIGIISTILSPFNKKINSPIVSQGLHELRKVVNSLITEYAIKPDIIRVELARELKMSKEKRETILSRNSKNAKENQAIIEDLIQNFQGFNHEADVRTDDITKYKLWKECNNRCPYTGNEINATDLFHSNDRYQIEHILPRSRSFDDSFQNKTLCEKSFNIDRKGNLMPYEMLAQGRIIQSEYDKIMERVKEFSRGGKRNISKIKKFTLHTIPQDMVAQQLNDTQFLSVAAKDYLKQICANVQPTVGSATSQLRKLWGLNSVLNQVGDVKNRNDHRHHAVDAIVVACTDIKHLQELSKFNKNKKYGLNLERLGYPYPTFRRDVKDAVEGILISHKVKNRPRGQMHDETMAGKVMNSDKSHKTKDGDTNQRFYTTRIALTDLIAAPAKVMKIGDKVVRDTVLQRLYEKGVNVNEKITKIPNDAFIETLWMPNKQGKNIHPIKHVRIHDVASNKIEIRKDTFVDGGNNHHIVIFQKPNGKREGKIVSMYEVMAVRKKNGLPVINMEVGDGNEFIMSLSTNEMVLVDSGDFKTSDINWSNPNYEELTEYLYRIQKITDGEITLRHHLTSVLKDEEGKEVGRIIKTPNSFQGIKVIINHIGEIKKV